MIKHLRFFILICVLQNNKNVLSHSSEECHIKNKLTTDDLKQLSKNIAPKLLHGKIKGEAGKIGIIGGSIEYTGAPYFAAISALKTGADLVYVVTTETAAHVIKSYSPDLIVYPYLNIKSASKISALIPKMDVVVIGPGLGREDEAITLTEDIVKTCKTLGKPLVIDADGLYAVSKNPAIIANYPSPGVILTPNQREANKLKEAVSENGTNWVSFWGPFVSVLIKGETDRFFSSVPFYNWSSSEGGTGRRAAGQGDILSGSLGTVYSWAFKSNIYCNHDHREQLVQSIATYAVARFTRECNSKAYNLFGRSMTASDMIGQIHVVFKDIFE